MGPHFDWILAFASLLLLFSTLDSLRGIWKSTANLRRLETKLDLLLRSAGIGYDPYKDLPAACIRALQSGKTITAIKEYRKATGAELKEAKDIIGEAEGRLTPSAKGAGYSSRVERGLPRLEAKLDLLLQNAGIHYDPYKDLPAACVQAMRTGNKIAAIEEFRKVTGAGLKEAKDFIEDAQNRLPPVV